MASTVQYVLVRSDLLDDLKWPIGAVIAQVCTYRGRAMKLIFVNKACVPYALVRNYCFSLAVKYC